MVIVDKFGQSQACIERFSSIFFPHFFLIFKKRIYWTKCEGRNRYFDEKSFTQSNWQTDLLRGTQKNSSKQEKDGLRGSSSLVSKQRL